MGNGPAAISAVQAIRSLTDEDAIVLVSKENCPACSLPLTTYYISGKISYDDIFLCDEGFYQQHKVEFIPGRKAIKVQPNSMSVVLEDGTLVSYDALLVATGASPLIPAIKGIEPSGTLTLRTAEEAKKLLDSVRGVQTVAIIGTGPIGIQLADALVKQGKMVIIIQRSGQVMRRLLDSGAARILEEKLRAEGIDLRLNEQVSQIEDKGERKELILTSGDHIEVDVVVLATGVIPNVAPLEGSGVKLQQGALVDEYARTNVGNIYAAGDVAEGVNEISGKPEVNATWTNAVEQGRTAGLNMAGRNVPRRRNLRVNITAPFGLPIASLGSIKSDEASNEVTYAVGENYRKLVFQDGCLVGAILVGDVGDAGLLVNLIEQRKLYPPLKEQLQKSKGFAPFARAFQRVIQ